MTQSMYDLTHGAQAAPLAVTCGQATDRGQVRRENQDCMACFEAPVEDMRLPLDWQRATVAVVADGMGGAAGGARASALAVAAFQFTLLRRADQPLPERLETALQFAQRTLAETAAQEPQLEGMGTTLVAAAVAGNQLYVIHAGDSRAYLVREGVAYQLTVDHSWVQAAQDEDTLSAGEAAAHPQRSVINRCLGGSDPIAGDHTIVAPRHPGLPARAERVLVTSLALEAGDNILLCSDGLHNLVALSAIAKVAAANTPQAGADQLMALANARGGPDNITVVVLAVTQRGMPSESRERRDCSGKAPRAIQASLLAIMAALVGVSAYGIPNLVGNSRGPKSGRLLLPSPTAASPATTRATATAGLQNSGPPLAAQLSALPRAPSAAPITAPPTATLYPTPTSTVTPTITPTPMLSPTSTPTRAQTPGVLPSPTAALPAQLPSPLATPTASSQEADPRAASPAETAKE